MSNIPISERVNWIGASESAALFDLSPFTTYFTLWHVKAGLIPARDLSGNERVEGGQFMEPAIGAWANQRWDMGLEKVSLYIPHRTVAGMGASLDFRAADGAPVEIKNVDSAVFREEWVVEGDEVIEAPMHYMIQVQHQLECCPEAPHGWLIPCAGGNRLFRLKVPRHERLGTAICQEVEEFWRSIRAGEAPQPDFESRIDGDALRRLYGRAAGTIDLRSSNAIPAACAEYLEAKEAEKAAKDRAAAALARISDAVGDHATALVQGYTITKAIVKETPVPATVRRAYPRWTIRQNER